MPKILVLYSSMTGNTQAAAEALAEGARKAGATVTLKPAADGKSEDLLSCDAVAFGSYDAFSYIGGTLKDFFDRTFYPTNGKLDGKPCAGFVTHGGGGAAIKSLDSIIQAFKMQPITQTLGIKGRPDALTCAQLASLGAELVRATTH